jgi:pimeloyl-ACP methyl ester carboxylesterase
MKKIYCITGLGADHRFFGKLRITGYDLIPVPWVKADDADTLPTYAMKMYKAIQEPAPVIIGLSFGGMLATEIKKQVPAATVILVSSAKTIDEIGYDNFLFKAISRMGVIPESWFVTPFPFILDLLGAQTEAEKSEFRQMMASGDPDFVKWCVNSILHWENREVPSGIFHIHGTDDKVIWPTWVHPDVWIEDGSHIMIYNRADEVAAHIKQHLSAQA